MPQARIAHQPRHASKALNSPIRIKIAKENCRNPTAGGTAFVVDIRLHLKIYACSRGLTSPAKGNVSRFHESEDFIARLEFHRLDRACGNNRREFPNGRLDDHFTKDFVGDNALDRSG